MLSKPVLQQLHVVRTQLIRLNTAPLRSNDALRPHIRALCDDEQCFTNLRASVRVKGRDRTPVAAVAKRSSDQRDPLPSSPFFHGLGPLCLNIDRLTLEQRDPDGLAQAVVLPDEWKASRSATDREENRYFNFDPDLSDQRMNFLAYSLATPLTIRAALPSGGRVSARLYVHLYPAGFLIMQLSASIVWPAPVPIDTLSEILAQTHPDDDSRTQWASRVKSGSLRSVMATVYHEVARSLFTSSTFGARAFDPWHTALRLETDAGQDEIRSALLDEGDVLNKIELSRKRGLRPGKQTSLVRLYTDRQFLVATINPKTRSARSVKFFWRILALLEFVMYQQAVYRDYRHVVREEQSSLADLRRRSLGTRLMRDELGRRTAYIANIPTFLHALDSHIRYADSSSIYRQVVPRFRRKLYHELSAVAGLDETRKQLNDAVKEWLAEVDAYEPALKSLFTEIVQPLLGGILKLPDAKAVFKLAGFK